MTEKSTSAVLEIAWFRLQPGCERAAFLRAADATGPLLHRCPGFMRRMLIEDQDQWADLVEWRDRASAMAAAQAVMQDPGFAPFMAMIDPESIRMGHHAIEAVMA